MSRIYDSWDVNPWSGLPNLSIYMDEQQVPQQEARGLRSTQIIVTLSNGNTLLGDLNVNLRISFSPQELVTDQNLEGLQQYNQGLTQSATTIERDLQRMFVDALQNRERELAQIGSLNVPDPEAADVRDDLQAEIEQEVARTPVANDSPMTAFLREGADLSDTPITPPEPPPSE